MTGYEPTGQGADAEAGYSSVGYSSEAMNVENEIREVVSAILDI